MFISKQRNSILNINEFTKKKVNNSFDVNINNEANILKNTTFKMTKSIMFNENRMKFENYFCKLNFTSFLI